MGVLLTITSYESIKINFMQAQTCESVKLIAENSSTLCYVFKLKVLS